MIDFWVSSGHLLVDKDSRGRLVATDDFIKLYLARPELTPPEDACAAEKALHAALLVEPRGAVGPEMIAEIADADARENWAVMLDFRDHLMAHPSLEDAYLALMRQGVGQTPPLFVNQLLHIIMRNVLDGVSDPVVLRAGEMMFRPQRLTQEQGGVLLADEEIVDGAQKSQHQSPLTAMLGEQKVRQLDVLKPENAEIYWKRSDQFDMVLDFGPDGAGRPALARVMERWLGHMLGLNAKITPLDKVHDEAWYWFVGLDAESTAIGNMLWRGQKPPAVAMERVVALYALDLPQVPEIAGRTIYLILSMSAKKIVTMKPQNLLIGLPDAAVSVAGGSVGRT